MKKNYCYFCEKIADHNDIICKKCFHELEKEYLGIDKNDLIL